MTSVNFEGVRKTFGSTVALEDLSLEVHSGELVCLLGPSGCGKTTALRILAGFERADQGEITVGGERIDSTPVERRNFGMVFQDYSLFPNMTALANIEFGLKMHKESAQRRREIANRMLEVTQLTSHARKFPHQLSGGQKQRVALARALATEPRVLLLDEPLSALDALVRDSLRDEIRRIQRELAITTIFVTHDQHEALAIADRVAVMSEGNLEQIATPEELYLRPANTFVANFIGTINRLPAVAISPGLVTALGRELRVSAASPSQGHVTVGVRPEQLEVVLTEPATGGVIRGVTFLGSLTRLTILMDLGYELVVDDLSGQGHTFTEGQRALVKIRDDVESAAFVESGA